MAKFKDLIVNGTSRFLGNVFAKKFVGDLEGNVSWENVTNKPTIDNHMYSGGTVLFCLLSGCFHDQIRQPFLSCMGNRRFLFYLPCMYGAFWLVEQFSADYPLHRQCTGDSGSVALCCCGRLYFEQVS